jgi:hypothetical protein
MSTVTSLARGETTEIPGVLIDDHTFVGGTSLATLKKITLDPETVEDARQRAVNPDLQQAYDLRMLVNRVFEHGKKKNVGPYSRYIVKLHDGDDGATPAIHLWTHNDLPVLTNITDWGHAVLGIPNDVLVMAIDGDTQLAARLKALRDNPLIALGRDRVPLIVHFHRPVRWAQNSFHDLNVLRVNVNAAISIGMDNRDAFTLIAKAMELDCPDLKGKVNTTARTIGRKHEKLGQVITIPALRHFVLGVAFGIKGQSYGIKPVPVEDYKQSDLPVVEEAAKQWFNAIANHLGKKLFDREHSVASSLPAIIALGAIGHDLLEEVNSFDREGKAGNLAGDLMHVKWEKGPRWEGILGNMAPKTTKKTGQTRMVFQIRDQGASRIATYAALHDTRSPSYLRVRQEAEPGPQQGSVTREVELADA